MAEHSVLKSNLYTQIIGTALRSSVAKNAASLYVIQSANYILPLITIPYLVRVLGPAGFGAVAFCQSLIAYFMIFVDYGFAWPARKFQWSPKIYF